MFEFFVKLLLMIYPLHSEPTVVKDVNYSSKDIIEYSAKSDIRYSSKGVLEIPEILNPLDNRYYYPNYTPSPIRPQPVTNINPR